MNRTCNVLKKSIALLLVSLEIFALILQNMRALNSGNYFATMFILLLYFTNQSNILILIISILVLLNVQKKWMDKLAFIGFVNITMTAVVFHIFLSSYFENLLLVQTLLHSVIPLIYFIFYMIFLSTKLKPHDGMIGAIYPLGYFIFIYLLIHPIFGNLLTSMFPNEPDISYVYPFLNPSNYDHGFLGVLTLSLLIMLPLFIISSIGLLKLKSIVYPKIWQNKKA